jgi:hypothetical protein
VYEALAGFEKPGPPADLEESFFFGVRCESALQGRRGAPTAPSAFLCVLSQPTAHLELRESDQPCW